MKPNKSRQRRRNTGKGKFKVEYEITGKISDNEFRGYSTLSDLPPSMIYQQNLSFLMFDKLDEAISFMHRNSAYNSPCIRPQFLTHEKGRPMAIMEDHGAEKFQDWIKRKNNIIWEFHGRAKCIGMGTDFCRLFSGISKSLRELHDSRRVQGKLEEMMRITHNHQVLFLDYDNTCLDFEEGVVEDMNQLEGLVRKVLKAYPMNEEDYPSSLKLFFELCGEKENVISTMCARHYAYLVCNNPLFWGISERYSFILKAWELRKKNLVVFDRNLDLSVLESTQMRAWDMRISVDTRLYKVLTFRNMHQTVYMTEIGFLEFMRNTYGHYQDEAQVFMAEVEKQLHQTFPDGVPKVFFAMIMMFCNKPSLRRHFESDLVSFYEMEPLALK